jgi:hypothetical protein
MCSRAGDSFCVVGGEECSRASALLCWTVPARSDSLTRMIGILIVLLIVFAVWAGNRVANSINNQN